MNLEYELWDARECGDYLRVAPRTVTEHYALLPEFPRAIRLPSKGKRGSPRWRAAEVVEWTEGLRDRKRA